MDRSIHGLYPADLFPLVLCGKLHGLDIVFFGRGTEEQLAELIKRSASSSEGIAKISEEELQELVRANSRAGTPLLVMSEDLLLFRLVNPAKPKKS